MLFADIDFASEKETDKTYPPDEATVRKVLDQFPFKPSFIQRSGGGLHVLWKLSPKLDCTTTKGRMRAAAMSKAFQELVARTFKQNGYDIDRVGDLARLVFGYDKTSNGRRNQILTMLDGKNDVRSKSRAYAKILADRPIETFELR